jgi:hypothetical protein
MKTNITEQEDLPDEIDFSQGERAKFYRPNLQLKLPIYLDDEVQQYLLDLANKRNLQIADIANDLIRKATNLDAVVR